ncbi:Uridine phosphorylase 1-like [Homarus americanus]|uniref:Uridine phosphorylase 1-like n=1 Tax=Homarus americanus TaxID=6706 RepID=A0A8J5JV61_HOMAM|nr:Uridine phosphorylase 1-like [Homarus americanus]
MPCHEVEIHVFPPLKEETQDDLYSLTRFPDDAVRLRNPHIQEMEQDILYHLALGSGSHDLVEMFSDVRFVCMGGTPKRMEVLCFSHGMGIPSVGILLHEVIKLMYHAKCKNPIFFRLGTCGGIGIEGGNLPVLGKMQRRPAILDKQLANDLKNLHCDTDPFSVTVGKTMCTYDFYEGQGRLDGAFCDYKEEDKLEFLQKIHDANVVNMEMESLCFAALCQHAGIKAAVICVTLLNRLHGDQVSTPKETLNKWQEYPQMLVARYIKKQIGLPFDIPQREHPQVVKNPKQAHMVRQESACFE